MPKWEAWNGKKRLSQYKCCKLGDLGGQEHRSKIEVHMAWKRHPKPLASNQTILMDFGKLVSFCWFFGARKIRLPKQKNEILGDLGGQGGSSRKGRWEGRGSWKVFRALFESCMNSGLDFARSRPCRQGAADLWATASSANPQSYNN